MERGSRLAIALEVPEPLDKFAMSEVGSKIARSRVVSGLAADDPAALDVTGLAAVAIASVDLFVAHAVFRAGAMDGVPRGPVASGNLAQRRPDILAHVALEGTLVLVILNVARTMREFGSLGDFDDSPPLLDFRFPARRAHVIAILPYVPRDVAYRVDPIEHRMNVREAADAVVLQRRHVLQPLELEVLDLRVERRARLLVARTFTLGPGHDEVIQWLLRAALRSGRFHLERGCLHAREVLAPDRERWRVVALVVRPFAHDIVDRCAETRRADHSAAAAVRNHADRSSRAIARMTVAISLRGSATVALILAISGSTRRMRSCSAQRVSWISSRCKLARS